jgi:hypothetical protein
MLQQSNGLTGSGNLNILFKKLLELKGKKPISLALRHVLLVLRFTVLQTANTKLLNFYKSFANASTSNFQYQTVHERMETSTTVKRKRLLTAAVAMTRSLASSAAVGTAWSLLGSPRNGQVALYLFQKHLLCWEKICNSCQCGCFLKCKGKRGVPRAVLPLSTFYLSTPHKLASNVVNHATSQFHKLAEINSTKTA